MNIREKDNPLDHTGPMDYSMHANVYTNMSVCKYASIHRSVQNKELN